MFRRYSLSFSLFIFSSFSSVKMETKVEDFVGELSDSSSSSDVCVAPALEMPFALVGLVAAFVVWGNRRQKLNVKGG